MNNIKICHLTSVHSRHDTRIFLKECKSLAQNGFDVNLIVADGKGNDTVSDIKIYDVGKPENRIERMTKTTKKLFKKAIENDADVYHFHDPELIPIGLKLKKLGKKVIYDVHEDVPRQLLNKPYLNKINSFLISHIFEIYENYAAKKFDYIITATPYIRDRFKNLNKNTVDVNNFPLLSEFSTISNNLQKENAVCYVGGITEIRGIKEMVKAMEFIPEVKLYLAGNFDEKNIEEEVKTYKGWLNVKYLGFLNRDEVLDVMSQSKAGIVVFYPLPNHIEAQPNKMFEYMSAGLPVIASNFPLWKEIVEGNQCGICVNPLEPKEIAKAIEYIVNHPEEAKKMGENGRRVVLEKYNWGKEKEKLIKIYEELLKR